LPRTGKGRILKYKANKDKLIFITYPSYIVKELTNKNKNLIGYPVSDN
jgi:hypothetical protein